MTEALMIGAIAILTAALAGYGWHIDARHWNRGVAPSGRPWRHFDTDSQGGRGYCDPAGSARMWISWPVDRDRT